MIRDGDYKYTFWLHDSPELYAGTSCPLIVPARVSTTFKLGDMGPYWEDGIGSDSYYAAEDRTNQSDALSSEIVSTVPHLVNPEFHPPKAELDNAWNNILSLAEHTWGAGNSISQPDSEEAIKQLAVNDNLRRKPVFN